MSIILVGVLATLTALAPRPLSADFTVSCTGGTIVDPILLDDTNGNVTLTGSDVCELPAPKTINGNLIVSEAATVRVFGTVSGNIEGNSGGALVVAVSGVVNGNVIQEGAGPIVMRGATVNGNINMLGTGDVGIAALICCAVKVTGNTKSEGPGSVVYGAAGPGATLIHEGAIENVGGGSTDLFAFSGGSVTVNSDVCGTTPPIITVFDAISSVVISGKVGIC